MKKITCEWPTTPLYHEYHDYEWGRPIHDDQLQFEHLCLENLQCGLSWLTILNKRDIIRACFDQFDIDTVAAYGESDIERIMQTEGMVKYRLKIEAIINNASAFKRIQSEFGSFCNYIWGSQIIRQLSMKTILKGIFLLKMVSSTRISKDLKKRGFKFVGPVTIYSHLQASGLINDHGKDCPCFEEINKTADIVRLPVDDEA